ncbi:hypothetical protein V6N11_027048 [Hibiscus sabdariffa]|uniref:DUF7792 domain-containing protein n=1 Tax=Hibiscus sabdariffa TaxID=183260 RepID=A0ABR2PFS0_9ROSI
MVDREAQSFKQDCQEPKAKTEKLSVLLHQAARSSNGLYRVFTIIPVEAFRKLPLQLENSIGDVVWLLRASDSNGNRDNEHLSLPPIATDDSMLCLVWEQIPILHAGSLVERSDASALLVSLVRDSDRYGKEVHLLGVCENPQRRSYESSNCCCLRLELYQNWLQSTLNARTILQKTT